VVKVGVSLSKELLNSYEREHVVKVCREECMELGYSGPAFSECVNLCVERYRGELSRR